MLKEETPETPIEDFGLFFFRVPRGQATPWMAERHEFLKLKIFTKRPE
jgi:hypothetical protein